ncbi:MAG: hypothetical protein AV945_gp48 [Phormidium phage MIS-PhV1B]|jgi:hypothetical protein|uniref:hypothetical protein n=1 Tax=Phormidium phage MIS-PhV1B TaxID=1391456 RepID=UPI0003C94727|nr:MAG: hypothetical protein AV945_gp48 [Phormidium phage MIS-PhV1B]AGZ61855.1 MAG: hypothetical protein [Phormidium phage MIS-PhV1B]
MDMKIILDIMGIIGGLSSFVFWISSNHIYKDVITQIKEIRNETKFTTDHKIITIFNKLQRNIDKIFVRITTLEARLEYLEEIQTDKNYSGFVEKLSNAIENSDFTEP